MVLFVWCFKRSYNWCSLHLLWFFPLSYWSVWTTKFFSGKDNFFIASCHHPVDTLAEYSVAFWFVLIWSYIKMIICFSFFICRDEIRSTNASKVTLTDVMVDPGECVASFDLSLWTCLSFAFFCWVIKMISVIYHFFQFAEIRNFYRSALHVGMLMCITESHVGSWLILLIIF